MTVMPESSSAYSLCLCSGPAWSPAHEPHRHSSRLVKGEFLYFRVRLVAGICRARKYPSTPVGRILILNLKSFGKATGIISSLKVRT